MALNRKKNIKRRVTRSGGIISNQVRDYGKLPYFIAEANEAREYLKKIGLPKELKDVSVW